MEDQTTLEQKRAQAQQYRGVSYDGRIGLFTAAITINGRKEYLGSFPHAEDASAAYDRAREAHPIIRERSVFATTIRREMAAFSESAARSDDKHKNILAGQIFTAPGGQRFRVEGFQFYKGRGWYLWSSRCRHCGALFEQRTTLKTRDIVSMLRNCEAHREERIGRGETPTVWPDPESWANSPSPNTRFEKADAATLRAHDALKDEAFYAVQGDKAKEAEFYAIERDVELPFKWAYDEANPKAGEFDWLIAWNSQPVNPYREFLAKAKGGPAPSDNTDLV